MLCCVVLCCLVLERARQSSSAPLRLVRWSHDDDACMPVCLYATPLAALTPIAQTLVRHATLAGLGELLPVTVDQVLLVTVPWIWNSRRLWPGGSGYVKQGRNKFQTFLLSLSLCMVAAQPTASESTRDYPVSDGQRIIFGRPAGAKSCCNHNSTDTIPTELQATYIID
jgi:hypothetical protein